MSSITASQSLISGKSEFLLRRLHSLTGIMFGGYIVIHLIVNATMIQGTQPGIFQMQVEKIHGLPFLEVIEWSFIYLPIIFHTIYGIYITFAGRPNVVNYPFAKNWFYLLQRISAFIIIAFLAFHVLGMKGVFGSSLEFDADHAFKSTVNHIHTNGFVAWVLYPLGILASCFHLANGFWSAAITWGLTVSARAQARWGLVCIGIFLLTFSCGMTALAATVVIKP